MAIQFLLVSIVLAFPSLAQTNVQGHSEAAPRPTQRWVCDMHCEACKTYADAGRCPVCKMKLRRFEDVSYSAEVNASGAVMPGKPAELTISLLDPAGCEVKEVEVVRGDRLRLVVVSDDLSWFSQEHPLARKDGVFSLGTLVFPHPGKYTVFADFTTKEAGNQIASVPLAVPGDAPKTDFKLVEDFDVVGRIDDYEFRVRCNGKRFFAGVDSFLRIGIDKGGRPVTDLEPLMGAKGNLVIVSQDLNRYMNVQPMGGDARDPASLAEKFGEVNFSNGKPSDVSFHVVFPQPGPFRVFAQFKHKGMVLTFPFTVDVQTPEGMSDSPGAGREPKPEEHKGHDHDP